ncbi:hypothetical protein ACJX0J_021775, partial [Zea mays]
LYSILWKEIFTLISHIHDISHTYHHNHIHVSQLKNKSTKIEYIVVESTIKDQKRIYNCVLYSL